MLTNRKRLDYRTKVRMFLIVGIILTMDFVNYVADSHAQEVQGYKDRIVMLEAGLDHATVDLVEAEDFYRDKLMEIVTTVYEREFYSMGGYETPYGADVTEIYQAILNEVQDYGSMLSVVDNYFDRRTEYLKEIPSVWPIEYNEFTRITSGFGWRLSPITGDVSFHPGLDIAGVWNSKIIATADGVIKDHWRVPGLYNGVQYYGHSDLGCAIKIQHVGGFKTVYGHLSESFVREGQIVKRGDVIGIMGNTGTSKGRHLHYELHHNGVPVNPLDHLQF